MPDGDLWFFERLAPVYDRLMPPADAGVLSAALARAGGGVERVVDVGGGSGRAVRALDVPGQVVVDASLGMLQQVPPDVERVRASATALPVAEASVDAVLIVDALHHLPEQSVVVGEAMRVLRPGGVLVIREFDRTTLRGRILEVGEHALGMNSRFLSTDELLDRVEAAGLAGTVMERGFACTVVGRKPGGP